MICPASPGSRAGNRTTALRWAAKFRALGHRVRIAEEYRGEPCDILIALHAHKSAASVSRSIETSPDRPIVLALTGTDLYRHLPSSVAAQRSLAVAWRLGVRRPLAIYRMPEPRRAHPRADYRSA